MLDFLNHLGAPAWNLARTMFLQTAVLVAALVLFDLLFGRRLRSALRYALWLLVVVKLLLPPSLLLPTGAGFWLGRWFAEPVVVKAPAHYQVTAEEVNPTLDVDWNQSVVAPTSPPATLSLHAKLLAAWAVGSLLLGMGMLIRNRPINCLIRKADAASPELRAVLREAAESLSLRRLPALRLSGANHSPALCGFFRPVILLPRELAGRLSSDGLRAVLLHELTHLRRNDLWVNLLQAVVQVLWWWNPVVWLANARIRTLREQAVDESVMLATRQDRATYPSTLVEVARHCAARPMLALSFLGIFESRRALRSRVDRLLNRPLPRRANLGWTGWLLLLAAACVALPMAFNRRVEAAPADEPKTITRPTAAAPASGPGLSPALAARYGLDRDAASTNERTSSYRMDPVLARRYGLVPANPTPGAPNQIRVVTLTVPAEDTGFDLDGRTVNADQLQAALAERMAPNTNLVLRLIANHEVPMSRIVFALDAAKAAGITRMSLSSAPSDEAGRVPLTVEDGRKPAEPAPLFTRQFRVDPNTFIKGLESVLGVSGAESTKGGTTTRTNLTTRVQDQVRDFFRAAGVDFPTAPTGTSTPEQARKALFFNDRAGVLFVRATEHDLEIVAQAIQVLNVTPPQVEVEVKFVEIEADDSKTLGFDWFLGNTLVNPATATSGGISSPGGDPGSGLGGVFPQAGGTPTAPASDSPRLTGILSDQQFRTVTKALEARQGVNLLSAPKVVTLSGRQAQISMVNVQPIVDANGKTNSVPFGPALDVIPFVTADGQAIQLTVIASFTELLGTDPSAPHLPRMRSSQLASSAAVWDSQTLVLAGDIVEGTAASLTNPQPVLGGIPAAGPPSSSEAKPTRKRLLVFITPTIIDPAGQRVHDPARLPFDPNTVPPQPK